MAKKTLIFIASVLVLTSIFMLSACTTPVPDDSNIERNVRMIQHKPESHCTYAGHATAASESALVHDALSVNDRIDTIYVKFRSQFQWAGDLYVCKSQAVKANPYPNLHVVFKKPKSPPCHYLGWASAPDELGVLKYASGVKGTNTVDVFSKTNIQWAAHLYRCP